MKALGLGATMRARGGAALAVVIAAAAASLSCGALYRYKVRDLAHDHPDVVYFVDTRAKAVALTLDDGPDAATTPAILDLLGQHGARATFFLITSRVAGNEELVRRMLAEGHEIGNHMPRDEPSIKLPPQEFERQLDESHELLSGFAPMHWFRPGSGHYDARMLKAVDRRGYRLALGSVYPFDPQIKWSWFSRRFILGNVREGSIVILHDSGSKGKRTLKTLKGVLPELTKRGFRVVTLSELEALRGAGARAGAKAPDVTKLDAAVRSFMARESIGAAHVTVIRGDETLLERGYGSVSPGSGPPDSRSVFPIGSISKQFTAAAIVALAEQGKVRLDAPVGDYLPEWFAGERDLRVTHLLTQTSGVADFLWLEGYRPLADDPSTPKSAFIALAARAPRRFRPGERWAYSNTNFKALALIAERVEGKPFDTVVEERVLRPAGIDGIQPCHDLAASGFVAGFAPTGKLAPLDASRAAYAGDGGLCANAAGLVSWVRKGMVARKEAPARLARQAVPTMLNSGQVVPYGFGLSTREFLGHPMLWHGGNVDGHSALIAYAPKDELGIVVLTNKGFVWLTELLPAWIGEPVPQHAPATGEPPLGRFEDALFKFTLAKEGEELEVEIDLIGKLAFVPAGANRYIARDYPATFMIQLPDDASRDSFEFNWGEVRSYAHRVQDPP